MVGQAGADLLATAVGSGRPVSRGASVSVGSGHRVHCHRGSWTGHTRRGALASSPGLVTPGMLFNISPHVLTCILVSTTRPHNFRTLCLSERPFRSLLCNAHTVLTVWSDNH